MTVRKEYRKRKKSETKTNKIKYAKNRENFKKNIAKKKKKKRENVLI